MKNVSVIIPIFNRKSFIDSALSILMSQTLKNIEFIIVDDGSIDGSYEYIVKKTKSDKRFKIFKLDKNSGPSVARNFALSKISGEYIGFFDIDDNISSDYFEKLYKHAIENDVDIVFGTYNNMKHKKIGKISQLTEKIESLYNGALWDKLFKKDLILQNNISFPDGLYCADNVFVFTAFYYAKSVFVCNDAIYLYTLNPDSISFDNHKTEKRKNDILKILEILTDFVQKHKFNDIDVEQTYNFFNRTFNSYQQDTNFKTARDNILLKIRPKGVYSYEQPKIRVKHNMMLLLKIRKFLGLISRQRFDDTVLINKVKKSGLFDGKWYLNTYPDVANAKMNPVQHYLQFGWREGRNPSPKFDTNAYLMTSPDVASADICPLLHYIDSGYREGRYVRPVLQQKSKPLDDNVYLTLKKSKLFDKKWYLKKYPDVKRAHINPIKHYINFGATEYRNPSKYFNTKMYLNMYPDVEKSGTNPLYHYIKWGANEGRIAKTLSGAKLVYNRTLKQKIKYAWEYPIRVHNKYHRLKDKIREIKKSK